MGFLKDLRRIKQLSKESAAGFDTGTRLAELQQKMDAASEAMATGWGIQPSPGAVAASASIVATRSTGTVVNGSALVEIELLVLLATGIPQPATVTVPVGPLQLALVQPGRQLAVTYEPSSPATSVAIDWSRVA